MQTTEPIFSSLEQALQRALQRIEPPRPFVHSLGRKIRVTSSRSTLMSGSANSLAFFWIVLIGAFCVGLVSFLLARLLRQKSPS